MPASRRIVSSSITLATFVLLGLPRTAAAQGAAPAGMAGTWRVKVMDEKGDSIGSLGIRAGSGRTGWVLMRPNMPPVAMRVVAMNGDSVVTEAGPYASTIRPGMRVRTHGVFRMQGSTLMGTTLAHYLRAGKDSVANVRLEGTRAQ